MANKKLVKPAILSIATYLAGYLIPKLIVDESKVHFVKIALDDKIPLVKPFIIIYFLAFVQWSLTMHILTTQNTKYGYKYCTAIIIGSIVGSIIFIVYPTGVQRIGINGNGILDFILKTTYSVDSIVNALPSFHVFCSWMCLRGLWEAKGIDKKWKIVNSIFSILVCLSTLFTKQHYFLDVPAGILLAEISILIANRFQFTKLFNKL